MGTHNVFVIDTRTNDITATIDLTLGRFSGLWPFRLAITPDGTKVFVANMFSDNISVINASLNRAVAEIGLGHFVHDVVFSPDGRRAYVDLGWDRLAVIDVIAGRVTSMIFLDDNTRTSSLAVSRDGRQVLALATIPEPRLYVIDATANTVSHRIDLEAEMTNQGIITLSPSGREVYVPCGITGTSYSRPGAGTNRIYVVDLAARAITARIPVVGGPIVLRPSPNGRVGYVSTFARGKIFTVDLARRAVTGEIAWGRVLEGQDWKKTDIRDLAVTPDGRRLYAAAWDADGLLAADLSTGQMTDLVDFNTRRVDVYELALTRDGRRLFVATQSALAGRGDGYLNVIDTRTRTLVSQSACSSYPANPCLDASGRLYAVAGNRILILSAADGRVLDQVSLGSDGGFYYDLAVSASQGKAYVTNTLNRFLYVVDLNRRALAKRISVGRHPQMVVLSPDGRRGYVSRQNNLHDSGGLVVIDTVRDEVVARLAPPRGVGPGGRYDLLKLAPGGGQLYWSTSPDYLNIVNLRDNTVIQTVNLQTVRDEYATRGIHPSDIAFTSDRSRAYITCGDSHALAIWDVARGRMTGFIPDVGVEPLAVVLSPDDRFAYVTCKEEEAVAVINLAERRVVRKISVAPVAGTP